MSEGGKKGWDKWEVPKETNSDGKRTSSSSSSSSSYDQCPMSHSQRQSLSHRRRKGVGGPWWFWQGKRGRGGHNQSAEAPEWRLVLLGHRQLLFGIFRHCARVCFLFENHFHFPIRWSPPKMPLASSFPPKPSNEEEPGKSRRPPQNFLAQSRLRFLRRWFAPRLCPPHRHRPTHPVSPKTKFLYPTFRRNFLYPPRHGEGREGWPKMDEEEKPREGKEGA